MIFLDNILSKLTDAYKKTKESKIGRLISIGASPLDDIDSTLTRMEEWRDIDLAKGKALDRLGQEIVGEFRGSSTDEEYRLKIKTRIVTNFLSDGDIESINRLLQIYLNEHFISAQEGWSLKGSPFDGEPAMLFITVKGDGNPYGIPFSDLNRVGIGGIGTQWQYLLERELTAADEYQRWMYPFENYAGHMIAAGEQITNGNALYQASLEISGAYSKADNLYLICGDYVSGDNISKDYNSNFELSGVYSSFLQNYPICGNFVAGEVI